jgi:proteasome activator subunit 4
VIQLCTPYFPEAANKEILDELLPQLQPLDIGKSDSVMEMLSLFLNPNSYELWFDDFMNLWETYHYPPWNADIMNLMASTAAMTIGLIDWNPHIPTMFTRILRSLDLPVSYKQMKSAKSQTLCPDASATWIVSVLGPKTDAMKYLRSFMSTIESYLHPANSGKWVRTISELLAQLVKYFHDRLISEKYKKHPWKPPVPDDYKLREQDITDFVEIFKPVAFQAMYSRIGSNDIGKVFKALADMRPELVLPGILDRVFTTIDSITEPHKFTASLQCLASVANVMVNGRRGSEAAKTQVIPLLFAVLPGIDSNDFKKTSITLQYIITQSILIPFVDCSKASTYYDDLTEDESLICEQTAQFEDFVLQFLDRIFVLIESSSVESTRMEHTSHMDNLKSKLESISEALIQSASHSVLGQCSQPILDSCTKKLVNYVKSRLLEPRVAGPAMSTLCRVFARVNGKDVYRTLLPYLIGAIENYFDDTDEVFELEKQNDEFLYHLVLLSNLVRGNPIEIQDYIDDVIPVMDKLLKCKCKIANRSGANMLTNLVISLSTMQTNDVKTVPEAFTLLLKDFLPIRHWARKMNREETFDWFVPGAKESAVCKRLIYHYLLPILEKFQKYVRNEAEISRDDMCLYLYLVTGVLKCNNFLNNWSEEPVKIIETVTLMKPLALTLGFDGLEILMPNGENVRLTILNIMHQLQEKILEKSEDDIKSLKQLLAVYEKIHCRLHSNSSYDSQSKSYQLSKQFQDFKLCRTRKDIRAVVATRVIIQQDLRDEVSSPAFTNTHRQLMLDMIKLSTSHYSAVRSIAQSKLFKMFNVYSFAYRTVVDEIAAFLKLDPNENHESFKGALYLIGTNRRHRLILRPDWEIVEKLWLALLKTQLSEKLSILRLMDAITDGINNEFQTIATRIEVSDEIAQMGAGLMVDRSELPDDFMKIGAAKLEIRNKFNEEKFHAICSAILRYTQENSLHWRYHLLAGTMINDLMHPTSKYPPEVTRVFVNNLIHESIEERSTALRIVNTILKQQKREHPKITIDPFAIAGVPRKSGKLSAGMRDDNMWLQYDPKKLPKSQAEWDEPRYMYKINGFFGWSPKVETYAPSSKQPKLDRNLEEMTDHERHFYAFFSQKANVDKLIAFWSLEEKKGKEKFNRSRFWLIKSIFDIFGDFDILDNFVTHLPGLIENKTNESSHRCAAEIVAGILRGAKHWNYEKTAKMYEKIIPLIRAALNSITNETDTFWGTSFATAAEGIDPLKQHFLHEVLLEDPIKEEKSFIDCSRLYCLQGAFNQHG